MRQISFDKFLKYFSKQYEFYFCSLSEETNLSHFIDRYWKKNHALVKSKSLLEWQHLDNSLKRFSFVVAKHKATGEFHAIQGFILSSQFDKSIKSPIRWGAIWKNRFPDDVPGLGMMVEQYMAKYAKASVGCGIGLSDYSFRIGKKENNVMGKVDRYYILNEDLNIYQLVSNINMPNSSFLIMGAPDLKRLTDISEEEYLRLPDAAFRGVPFFKSRLYYVNRYYRHPIYHYHASAIMSDAGAEAVIFWRLCEYNGACCIRIVDYTGTGQELIGCYGAFKELLRRYHAEFLDFLNIGIPKEYFLRAGFLDRRDSDIILAHYFEPFLLENDDLAYEWDNHEVPVLIFKGDADQDRPNIIKE